MATLSAEEQTIVKTVHDFVEKQVKPVARDLEHADEYPEALIETMKEMGIFGLAIPEPYGFVQVSMPCYAQVTEELARGWMSLAGAMGGHTVVSKLLLVFGTEDQKQKYLPRMATGELRATMALTEPGGGSDLQAMHTTARRDGDGYIVNGSKTWITNARRSGLIALRPAAYCSAPPSVSIPVIDATWRRVWPNSSHRRPRWRSPWTRCACTAVTATPPSTTSNVTSVTRR